MAWQNNLENRTYEASVDLSAAQFKIVELTGTALEIRLASDSAVGILQNIPQANEAATVAVKGQSKFHAGASVSIGNLVKVQSGGWGIAVASGDALPITTIGKALTAPASGDLGVVEVNPQAYLDTTSGSIVDAPPA